MKKFGILLLFWAPLGFSQQISFQPPIALPTLNGPVAMISADFNGDGTADLAISDTGSHVISISLGKGDGTFQAAATYSVPSGCAVASLAAADFNNDHKLDLLAICQFTPQLLVYLGHGDGTFGTPVSTQLPLAVFAGTLFLEAGSAGVGGTVADFNADGKLDLVLLLASDLSANFSAPINIYFLPGNGDGSFGPAVQVQRGISVAAVASGDFNGDGKPDLAYLTLTDSVDSDGADVITQSLNIDLGNGDGTFRNGPSYLWTGATFALTAVDVNGDGFIDLVSAGTSLASISGSVPPSIATVMLGDGKGNFRQSFKSTDSVNDLGVSFCLGNFSGSGHLDLVEIFAELTLSSASISLGVGTRAGNGDGTFQSIQTFQGPADVFAMATVCTDLNGDGLTDLAYTGMVSEEVVGVLANSGGFAGLAGGLAELPAGELYLQLNSTPQKLTFSNVNAASFAKGPLATNSIATAFWISPEKPSGIGVNVTDAAGATRPAQIFYVSSKQINYGIPNGTVTGPATITITGTQDAITAQQVIAAVAPGVFNAGGLAVGSTLTVHNGTQTPGNLVEPDASGTLQPVPIDVGTGSDQVFLILYGTGIRNHAQPVTATIGTTAAPVAFAAAQGTFVDEDQINVLVPQSLRGAGRVNVVLTVDGQTTNPVTIQIK
jgi:uncharacterized protein (TIGR03437 family)